MDMISLRRSMVNINIQFADLESGPVPVFELVDRYKEGASINSLATEYCTTEVSVRKILRQEGVKIREVAPSRRYVPGDTKNMRPEVLAAQMATIKAARQAHLNRRHES